MRDERHRRRRDAVAPATDAAALVRTIPIIVEMVVQMRERQSSGLEASCHRTDEDRVDVERNRPLGQHAALSHPPRRERCIEVHREFGLGFVQVVRPLGVSDEVHDLRRRRLFVTEE